jgi:hypothetical protein
MLIIIAESFCKSLGNADVPAMGGGFTFGSLLGYVLVWNNPQREKPSALHSRQSLRVKE